MAIKNLNTRIQHKIDTYANWSLAIDFIPLKGEIIIYTPDDNNTEQTVKLKIGNGKDFVNNLDFISSEIDQEIIQNSENGVSGGAVFNAISELYGDVRNLTQNLNGFSFRVSSSAPDNTTSSNTITFVV